MIGRLSSVVFDCPDPQALAGFYAEVLGVPVTADEGDWVDIGDVRTGRISFQRAPDHVPPDWPDPGRPQQVHLDIRVDEDVDEAERRLLELGAVRLAAPEGRFRVYADPAGHPFCLEWE
ncbi:VOC family protein [Nocardiopsis sp. CNT-189]|uniref:VOC family protein n=1 Tax=Nocardiopsis oceanisediminis TaxID=2816862 RepID=UPI003B2D765F